MGRNAKTDERRQSELRSSYHFTKTAQLANQRQCFLREPTTWKQWLIATALVVVVFLAYQPAWNGGFLFDDDLHLLNNPVLKTGGLKGAWVPGTYINYWPLTFTIYRFEFDIWGLNPIGFHMVNIALHSLTAVLLWRVLVELNVPGAMMAAAIFALHPVNVESVAWISQLKGILSLLFALASVLFYLQFDRRGESWRYTTAIAAFGLSTLAKGMVLTLPIVLLACVWWRRGSLARQDLLRVVPYLLIGAIMTGLELWHQNHGESVRSDSPLNRAAVAGCAVWFYFGKLLLPIDLCFIYPRWKIEDVDLLWYLPGLLLVVLFVLAFWRRRTWGRPVMMLIICYVALLLPVLGFVNINYMRYSLVADHWQYAAMIVPCAVLTGLVAVWMFGRPSRRPIAYALSFALLASLTALTWRQCRIYKDADTLYESAIESNPGCWMAHYGLGVNLARRGQHDEAIAHYQKALDLKPNYVEAHILIGMSLIGRGQIDEAIAHYKMALGDSPDNVVAHIGLGNALVSRKRIDEAIGHFQNALEKAPDNAEAHNNLGAIFAGRGQVYKAIDHYRKALKSKPDYALVHNNLGVELDRLGQVDEAIYHYRRALKNKPDYAEAAHNLGLALASHSSVDEAIVCFRQALDSQPDFIEAHINLGVALTSRGQIEQALAHYQKALDLASAKNDKGLADSIRTKIHELRK